MRLLPYSCINYTKEFLKEEIEFNLLRIAVYSMF